MPNITIATATTMANTNINQHLADMLFAAHAAGTLHDALKEVAKAKLATSPNPQVQMLMGSELCVEGFACTLQAMLEKSTDWDSTIIELAQAQITPIIQSGMIVGLMGC